MKDKIKSTVTAALKL